ncbi:hypothetical protein G7013_17745 [Pseudomonas viridiflava]|uniref:hypothetical protein n=1 Tax=Pseudomonas viridiflava TaxID=33069 RepID=UPI0015E28DA3|nr:hypothetical protein [Pseudomonas viridiflava]MBA1231494.1 hypothetical protein [Pseudomonas viridiflava]
MKAIAAAIIITLVGVLLVGIQHYQIVALRGAVEVEATAKKKALDANLESEATITTLRAEAQRDAAYLKDLNQRIKASEDKAKQARKDFEDLKRNSKPVRDWASQPLPDGLRGKASGGNKNVSRSNRAP